MNNFAHCATQEAINNSGINLNEEDKTKIGICFGIMSSNTTKMAEYSA